MSKPSVERAHFAAFEPVTTRWSDNDQYGHVNNVVYYSYFDTAVNAWLLRQGLLQPNEARALVAHTDCDFFAPLAFPQAIEVGLRVVRLGNSSVTYALGVFAQGAAQAAAVGHFVHVLVSASDRQPMALPPHWRAALSALQLETPE